MANSNVEFMTQLLATFRLEASEHLDAMSSGLIELENTPGGEERSEALERIYREAHSLKGAARAVNLIEVESVCHSLESVFAELKSGRVALSPALLDLVHEALDVLTGLLASDAEKDRKADLGGLFLRLDTASKRTLPLRAEPQPAQAKIEASDPSGPSAAIGSVDAGGPLPAHGPGSGTIRVHIAKLDLVMRQTEELYAPRLAAGQHVSELREAGAALAAWSKERGKVQPALRSIERSLTSASQQTGGIATEQPALRGLLEYMEAERVSFKALELRMASLQRTAEHGHRTLSGMTDNLLHAVKEMHMLPFTTLIDSLPRLTRDLARDQAKRVELVTHGGDIEIDRRILEGMKDPLIHLVRNCVDHGIEKPAVREQKGKPPHGTLVIAVTQKDSGKVEIVVSDDGAGIDVAKVGAAARRLGVLSAAESDRLGARDALALVFRSGVSTSPMITEISGRGLGLAIVREKVEHLGGTVAVESAPDTGTTVRIVLPLTLAMFRGVLVRTSERLFIIPVASVERVTRVPRKDIRTVENRETIPLDGRAVSLVSLSDVLELPRALGQSAENAQAVVLGDGLDRVAFQVDAVLAEQQVLVKGLGPQLARVRHVAGASVLGTGEVVPVLNVPDLMRSARKSAAPHVAQTVKAAEETKRSVLVVEDSITSRALLKNILEAAGYDVSTAVDGVDAYTTLKTRAFDIVVSDVEMPRMDGFDLTAKVRADKQLSRMPVVLVTALESREHRERGIDVGANAYIVKSSFDQSNLLEVVRRLV